MGAEGQRVLPKRAPSLVALGRPSDLDTVEGSRRCAGGRSPPGRRETRRPLHRRTEVDAARGMYPSKPSKMLNSSERSPTGLCDWASESLPVNSSPKTSTWPAASSWPKTAAQERKQEQMCPSRIAGCLVCLDYFRSGDVGLAPLPVRRPGGPRAHEAGYINCLTTI
jgi:hypothetical protein